MIKSIKSNKKIFAITSLIASIVLIYIKPTSPKLIQIQDKAEIKKGNHMPSVERGPYKKNIEYVKVQIISIP